MAVVVAVMAVSATARERVFGKWVYVERKDKFDDTDTSFIYTASEAGGQSLAVMRMADGINIVYNWGSVMAGDSDKDVSVRYRVQGQKARETEYWRLLVGHKAAYARMDRVQGMFKEFGAGVGVSFRVTDPMDGEVKDAEFSFDGFAEALEHFLR